MAEQEELGATARDADRRAGRGLVLTALVTAGGYAVGLLLGLPFALDSLAGGGDSLSGAWEALKVMSVMTFFCAAVPGLVIVLGVLLFWVEDRFRAGRPPPQDEPA